MKRLAILLAVLGPTFSVSVAQQSEAETARRLHRVKSTAESSNSVEERFTAIEQFVKNATPDDSVALLISTLNDESPEVRGLAARELGKIRPAASAAVPALVARLNDNDYRTRWISNHFAMQRAVRFDVADALGRIGTSSRSAMPKLIQAAQSDKDAEVRVCAALAILRIAPEGDEPLGLLIAALGNDKSGTAGGFAET